MTGASVPPEAPLFLPRYKPFNYSGRPSLILSLFGWSLHERYTWFSPDSGVLEGITRETVERHCSRHALSSSSSCGESVQNTMKCYHASVAIRNGRTISTVYGRPPPCDESRDVNALKNCACKRSPSRIATDPGS